ncbi:hypothetical protein AHF37_02839 [Paragonimus kellicotti]|nr:hypothetical protein AHF37_02839 [Paragonimus kellicotti]
MPTVLGQDKLFATLLNHPIPGDQHSVNAFCMANGKWHLNMDAHCLCQPGHEKQSQGEMCRGLPSVPRNLNAIRINGTTVVLTWDKPIRTGGFNTTEFRIGCQGCIPDRVKYTPGNVLNGTKVQIDGLQPMTRYQFDVYAQNPVSGLADAMWNNVASVIVTTEMGMQTKGLIFVPIT